MLNAIETEGPGLTLSAAYSPARKPKLAVISTYDELCGIAAYTVYLKKQLDEHFDATVFELDQFFLRHESKRVKKLGDAHIREICSKLAGFESVNLQLEYGTIGRDPVDILRRLRMIVAASPRLSVTFHTILQPEPYKISQFFKDIRKGQPIKAIKRTIAARSNGSLDNATYAMLRRAQKSKDVSVIVHTRRDMRMMKYVNRISRVYDHPLAFHSTAQKRDILGTARRADFPLIAHLPEGAKLVGVFGFLGQYKGFETAIRALQHLPEEYHLLIFGGVHPQTIRKEQKIDPYIHTLLSEAYVDTSLVDSLFAKNEAPMLPGATALPASPARQVGVTLNIGTDSAGMLNRHPLDLSKRLHFMGALPDAGFAHGMAICDIVVFPYLEVGQSSSGPISQAVELGKRIIASRTLAFLQLARYQKDTLEFFDIGNHLELAQRIAADAEFPEGRRRLAFDCESNMAVYKAANAGGVKA